MNRVLVAMVLYALFLVNEVSAEIEIKGTVKGGQVLWDNVTYSESLLTPSTWSTPPLLQTAEAWIPGTFASSPASSVTFFGGNGEVTSAVSVDVTGMQYNTAGTLFAITSNPTSMGCSLDKVNLPVVSVVGDNCISSYKLLSQQTTQPFVFFRPLFDFDTESLISALSGHTEGVYSASLPLVIRYEYENDGIRTYRNINETLIFSMTYEPVQLDSVVVNGDGVMVPNYDTVNRRVTANTSYDITANGYFNNGLVMTVSESAFELVNTTEPSVTIPYSMTCPQCGVYEIVKDGILIDSSTSIGSGSGTQTSINFNLDFAYDVDGTNITSGDYTGSVTIMLEPGL